MADLKDIAIPESKIYKQKMIDQIFPAISVMKGKGIHGSVIAHCLILQERGTSPKLMNLLVLLIWAQLFIIAKMESMILLILGHLLKTLWVYLLRRCLKSVNWKFCLLPPQEIKMEIFWE